MSYVAVDIETTGLDTRRDAITEVAAVRFDETGILETYQQLVNPNRHIPDNIRNLTHIDDAMVRDMPRFSEITDEIADFIGDSVIIGQNIQFDLSFLRQGGILRENKSYDTYDLASVLMPFSTRYKLGAIAEQLGIEVKNAHRALADAVMTAKVFNILVQKTYELPIGLLATLVRASGHSNWSGTELFRSILSERTKNGERQPVGTAGVVFPRFLPKWQGEEYQLKPADIPMSLDSDELAEILESGGAFSRYFEKFEPRQQQINMLRAVSDAFSEGHHMLIEAGTGTGKSFAYLIPAFHWAIQNGERVVISTNTLNLQDQLMQKDIPALEKVLGKELRATVQKGRGNYLCPRRVAAMLDRGAADADEMRVLGKILVWIASGGKGDRAALALNLPKERETWAHLSAENEGCRPNACPFNRNAQCPFCSVKEDAQHSHVVIVNHALLLADAVYANGVIPEYKYLVIDEGHHLESAATGAMSFRTTQGDINRLFQDLGSNQTGLMGRLLTNLRDDITEESFNDLNRIAENATEEIEEIRPLMLELFRIIAGFMEDIREGHPVTVYGQQLRITEDVRIRSGWDEVENAWYMAEEKFGKILNETDRLSRRIEAFDGEFSDVSQESIGLFNGAVEKLSEIHEKLEELFLKPGGNSIYWIEINGNNYTSLCAAPLEVGPMIQQTLWYEKESIILTSATLATNRSFKYMRDRLCADEADDLSVGSPFDYEHNVLLYLPKDIPDPNNPNMQIILERSLVKLCSAVGGRTLVLFTSYAQLKRTANAITAPLKEQGITVFEQGEGISASSLLETFRKTEKAVLLGTRSFWEGVDIQGEALSVVVIVKLPFDVPSDPIIAARAESFENSFAQYSLPEAILKFRQGFGRLIRSKTDRGIVVIMDSRMMTKRYGADFLNSIPKCTRMVDSFLNIPKAAVDWLKKKP